MSRAIGRRKTELVLSPEEHAQLSALAVSRSLPHVMVAHAKLVLRPRNGKATTRSPNDLDGAYPPWASGASASSSTASPGCTMNYGPADRALDGDE